jgi:hypothetical protein
LVLGLVLVLAWEQALGLVLEQAWEQVLEQVQV